MCKQGPFSQLVEGRRCPNRFLGFGGIAQSVAALIGKGSLYHAYHPYTEKIEQREIVLPKGHNVDYGTPVEVMVAQGGGQSWLRQHVQSEHVEMMISEKQRPFYTSKATIPCKKYADGGRSGQSGATPQGAANC